MANNRLYVGNTAEKKFLMISKGYGSGWVGFWRDSASLFDVFIQSLVGESDVAGKTQLVFFTEYDDLYNAVYKDKWEEIKPRKEHRPTLITFPVD